MVRISRVVAFLGVATLALVLPASAAIAADATGCSGSVLSRDASGASLGSASAPGEGGTQSDPLKIDPQGSVAWEGKTDAVISSGDWSVSAMGVTLLSGTFDNPEGKTSASGVQDLSTMPDQLGWLLSGNVVVPVSGSIVGSGGSCTASGFITSTGSPTSSPIFYAGIGAAVLGLALAGGVLAGTKAAAVTTAATGAGGVV